MCTTGSEDAVTVQTGTFTWSRDERPVLEKCVYTCTICSISYQLSITNKP